MTLAVDRAIKPQHKQTNNPPMTPMKYLSLFFQISAFVWRYDRPIMLNEPFHEIMVLFVLHRHILQLRMPRHQVGLND